MLGDLSSRHAKTVLEHSSRKGGFRPPDSRRWDGPTAAGVTVLGREAHA